MAHSIVNKIKKNWLYALFIVYGISAISYYVSFFINSNSRYLMDLSRSMLIFLTIFPIVCVLGFIYIFYRCAYKKPGIKLLAFYLIITPLSYIYIILQRLNLFSFSPKVVNVNFIYDRIAFILGLAISIIFYVFSLKLFKLNKKIKNVKISKD